MKRLALALLLVLPHAAHAGAWTQDKDHWQTIKPTVEWQSLSTPLKKDQFQIDTDHFFITVQ